jgi:hypothetical protein
MLLIAGFMYCGGTFSCHNHNRQAYSCSTYSLASYGSIIK